MADSTWHDLGPVEALRDRALRQITVGRTKIALVFREGRWSALSGVCNHAGGPLGEGRLDGEYVVCPWHHYKFHGRTGLGEPGFEGDAVPVHEVREEAGRLLVNLKASTPRHKLAHPPHPLERDLLRAEGPLRVVGISTTAMDPQYTRYSTSHDLLAVALQHAQEHRGAQTRMIRLGDLSFRHCEGYYSKSAQACTWPCSITQMDPQDQMEQVYEALVFWADVVLIATPIRWGAASSLYFKMIERLNCVQNQITTRDRVLLRNKVAAFIITGGQDNIQAVAGQMLMFFGEIGCHFPQFPFIAHSRGWTAEDMERNVAVVQHSEELREGARGLVDRALQTAGALLAAGHDVAKTERGGRKACSPKAAGPEAGGPQDSALQPPGAKRTHTGA